jgi:lysozyme family protein
MITNYRPFVERMIQRYEGGYGWNHTDPGGPTKYGITCFDLAKHRHQHMDSMTRWAPFVQAMSLAEADEIYDDYYAIPCAFDELHTGADCVVFDFGVNSGPSRAIKHAQYIVGTFADGVIGPHTLAAINAYDAEQFIVKLCGARLTFLQSLHTWSTFGAGWSSRVRDLRAYALRLLQPERKMVRHQVKLTRIPLAFAKGWEKSDVR